MVALDAWTDAILELFGEAKSSSQLFCEAALPLADLLDAHLSLNASGNNREFRHAEVQAVHSLAVDDSNLHCWILRVY